MSQSRMGKVMVPGRNDRQESGSSVVKCDYSNCFHLSIRLKEE